MASSDDEAVEYARSLDEFAQEDERTVSRVSCKPLFTVDAERSGLALLWNDSSHGTQILRSVDGLGDRLVADRTGMAELRLLNELLVRERTSPVGDALDRDREKWPVPIDCPLVPDVYQHALDTGLFD